MKFICTQENLLSGLTLPVGVSTKSGTLPILQNVKMETIGGALVVSATNLEIGVTSIVRGKVEQEGAISIDARLFLDYVKLLPNGKVFLSVESGKLRVSSESGEEADLQGTGVEEFPLIPKVVEESVVICRSKELREVLEKTAFAASVDSSRPEINGVFVRTVGADLIAVATDSFRLSERRCTVVRGEYTQGMIIPLRTTTEILKMLPISEEEVRFVFSPTQVAVQISNTELVSRVIEGSFPDYEQIIPNQFSTVIQAPQQQMAQTLKRAAVFSQGEGGELQLEVNPTKGKMRIRAKSQSRGSQHADITVTGKGGDITVVFNVRFVVEGLSSFSDVVSLSFVDAEAPAVMRGQTPDRGMYLLMPIRD